MSTLESWLSEGPFTLALSSSFFGFFAHCGFTSVIEEAGFRPNKITGASAGALIGGALASGLTPQDTRDIIFSLERKHFWDPSPGFGFLKGQKFLRLVQSHYAPSFSKTQIPLEVAAFDLWSQKTVFLKEGDLPSAVVASCAVPLMFHPVRRSDQLLWDGGLFLKSGINPDSKDERVLCVYLETQNEKVRFLGEQHRFLRVRNLPQVNPLRLSEGRSAYSEMRSRVLLALKTKFHDGQIIV